MKLRINAHLRLLVLIFFFAALSCQEKAIDENYIDSQISRFCEIAHVAPAACKCAQSELRQLDVDILLLYAKEGHYRKNNEKEIIEKSISENQIYRNLGVLEMKSVDNIYRYITRNRGYIDKKCGVYSAYFFFLIRGEEF